MKIRAATGEEIFVRGLHLSCTYEGLLEGFPYKEMNDRRIEEQVQEAHDRWKFRVHLIKPTVRWIEKRIPRKIRFPLLPPYCIHAWLYSRDDYYLTLVWFAGGGVLEKPLARTIQKLLAGVAWKEVAEYRDDYF